MANLTVRHRLARVHPFVWIAAAAAVVGLVAWPLGGWDTVVLQSTRIPVVEPGTLVDGQQYSVRVDAAELTDEHPDGFTETEPGWEFLILTMAVTNMTDETQLSIGIGDGFSGVVTIDDGALGWGSTAVDSAGFGAAGDAYLIADDTFLPDLQPRLAAPLSVIWEVPAGTWNVGDTITVGIVDRTPYAQTLSTGTGYRDPTVIATVDLRLEGS